MAGPLCYLQIFIVELQRAHFFWPAILGVSDNAAFLRHNWLICINGRFTHASDGRPQAALGVQCAVPGDICGCARR